MSSCCDLSDDIPDRQRRVLVVVLWINAAMFLAEFGGGLWAHSTALLADSVDMLGDAIVYGFSLYAVARGPMAKARAALMKGVIMAAFAVGVLVEVVLKLLEGLLPSAHLMESIGLVALTANTACLLLLSRHRADDVNMRSAWVCSRNDVVANGGVLLAAIAVAVSGSAWPDIVMGLVIAAIFGTSAMGVIRQARRAWPSAHSTSSGV
jgi:Co/Zn/Cd efflux system component